MAIGLYVHWPFCESKCPYCDFNSHVASGVEQNDWVAAYCNEIGRVSARHPELMLSTIFFGGGTPSLMEPQTVEAVVDAATRAWRCANDLEITLEANPGSVEQGRFRAYRSAGVNRISIGVQSLNDRDLRFLGRKHTASDAVRAIETAQALFDRVSFDLIYGRQNQTVSAWERELGQALSMGTSHLSLYQLTIEEGTVFAERARAGHLRGLPDDDLSAEFFMTTRAICEAYGLPAYEISNHARPSEASRHNMIYWTGGHYAGIGPGAHGRVPMEGRRIATEAIRSPQGWLSAVMERGNGEIEAVVLSDEDVLFETLLMGLRITDGIALERLSECQIDLDHWPSLKQMQETGHLVLQDGRLRATSAGQILLNTVITRLLDDVPRRSDRNIASDRG